MSDSVDGGIQVLPVRGLGEIQPGDDLARQILQALDGSGLRLQDGDILVVTQKVVSKAEGCIVRLDDVQPSALAIEWAERWQKDPRQVEVVLREAKRIVRMDRGVIITETKHGFVCANAGVDASNMAQGILCLLPPDSDASAERLRQAFQQASGAAVGVVISDTFGRAWRQGQTNIAIGVAGVEALREFAGQVDPAGYELRVTSLATADELAGAAELVMGKLDRVPVALVRGLGRALGPGSITHIVRGAETDLFR